MDENITPSDIGGMGPIILPNNGELGSGDVPAGEGDAEEEYKKKKKKNETMIHTNFNSYINEMHDRYYPDVEQWDDIDESSFSKKYGKAVDKWKSKKATDIEKYINNFAQSGEYNADEAEHEAILAVALKREIIDEDEYETLAESVNEDLRPDELEHLAKEIANHKQWDNWEPTDKEVMDVIKKDKPFGKPLLQYASSSQKKEAIKIIQDYLAESVNEEVDMDMVNTEYGFWGTMDQYEDFDSIEIAYEDAMNYLMSSFKFTKDGAYNFLNSKWGRKLADEYYDEDHYNMVDAIDGFTKPPTWKKYAKKFNESINSGLDITGGAIGDLHQMADEIRDEDKFVKESFNDFISIDEGTFQGNEIAIYSGEDGETYIEKRGKGYYGYNNSFDFEAKDKKELEQKLKSWNYYLVAGSLDEATMQRYSWVKVKKGEHEGEEGRIMVYGGPKKHSVVALDYGEYNFNPKELELVDESIDEAKAHNARTDLGYVAFIREFADWLNSRDLQEAYDNAIDVLQDKGMSEKQAIGFLNSPHGKYMGEYLVPGRDFTHEAFLDKLEEYYNERMLKKFAKDYAKLANIAEAISEGFFSRLKGKETTEEEKQIDAMIDQIQDTDVAGLFDQALDNLDTLDKVMAAMDEADPEDVDNAFAAYRKKTKNYKKFLGVLKGSHHTLKKQYGKEAMDDLGLKTKKMMDQFTDMSNSIADDQK